MQARPSFDRRPGRNRAVRRAPAAALAGIVALFAAPMLLGGAPPPSSAVLGVRATPAPAEAGVSAVSTDLPAAEKTPATRSSVARADPAGDDPVPRPRLAPAADSLTGYTWPIRNARLTLPFGPARSGSRIVNGKPFHDGIDLATFCGDRITAAHSGVVLAAGRRYDEFTGWLGDLTPYQDRLDAQHLWGTLPIVVVIDDGDGYRSMYAHFRRVVVRTGDVVEAGDLLGYEGATGRASGCHLHYGLFSPDEVATFGMEPKAAAHMLLPLEMIARIDPLLVLPSLWVAGIH